MPGKHRLRKAYQGLDIQKADDVAPIPGILGFLINGVAAVRVANRPGYVYVRFRDNLSEVCQAYNDTVSLVYNLPVLVIRDKTDRSRYRIQGRDLGRYENWATSTAYLPMHGSQHSFNPPDEGGDVVWVYSQQMIPFMTYPSGSFGGDSLFIKPHPYYVNNGWKYVGNTGSPSFLPYKPTSSNSKLALLYIDINGNPQIIANASEFPSTGTSMSVIFPYLPILPDANSLPLAAVRLSSGTSIIDWNNLYDVRQWLNLGYSSSAVGSGGGGSIAILDSGVFKVSGTAISFDVGLSVAVTGTTAFVNSTGGYLAVAFGSSTSFIVSGTATDAVAYNNIGNKYYPRKFMRVTAGKFTPQTGGSYKYGILGLGNTVISETSFITGCAAGVEQTFTLPSSIDFAPGEAFKSMITISAGSLSPVKYVVASYENDYLYNPGGYYDGIFVNLNPANETLVFQLGTMTIA